MSKERARRRAEREAAAAVEASRAARRARWNVLAHLRRARTATPGAPRPNRTSSALGRQRARQNALLLTVLVPLNVVYWLVQPAWSWRIGALVATALAWPLLVVVLFDRRASR